MCNNCHACRAGIEDEWEEEARKAEEHREPSQAVWAAYWGYDSCGPGGILDRLYTALRIPQKSWGGLKRLPEVGGISYERRHSYMHLVSNFLQVIASFTPLLQGSFFGLAPSGKSAPKLFVPAGASCVWSRPTDQHLQLLHALEGCNACTQR